MQNQTTTNRQISHKAHPLLAGALLGGAMAMPVAGVQAMELFSQTQLQGPQYDDNGTDFGLSVLPYDIVNGYAIVEGDMVFGEVDQDGTLIRRTRAEHSGHDHTDGPGVQMRGLGAAGAFERWPDGIIPFEFAENLSTIEREKVLKAINHWNKYSSILLTERAALDPDEANDYLYFESSGGCASFVGKRGGQQSVWVSEGCSVGSVAHEIGHAIGLFHEHTRADRDSYVDIAWDNISDGKTFNFDIMQAGATMLGEYDYGSLMHYGPNYFSHNGQETVIAPPGVEIGQRQALSIGDVQAVNELYATDLVLHVDSNSLDTGDARIDFTVNNEGRLGARELELSATLGSNPDWSAISAGTDWNCVSDGYELRCTLPKLIERDSTSFSVRVDPGEADLAELAVTVQAATSDVDYSNNALNDAVVPETIAQPTPVKDESGLILATRIEDDMPTMPGATPLMAEAGTSVSTDEPMLAAATGGGSAGGSSMGGAGMVWCLLPLLGLTNLMRRRMKFSA